MAVIGTPGTIASGAYQSALQAIAPHISVKAKACPLFVPLAEEGWVEGDVPRLVAERYLDAVFLEGVDTLVLGCTHYPLLRDVIQRVVGPQVRLVDSALATAEHVASLLAGQHAEANPVQHHYLVTDTPARFLDVAARFLGQPIQEVEQIDLALAAPPPNHTTSS